MRNATVISWLERAFAVDISTLSRGSSFQPPVMAYPQISGFFTSDEIFELEIRYRYA